MLTDHERNYAIKEAQCIAASEAYFEVRAKACYPQPHTVFDAGFSRGWDAACAERDARIAELTREMEEARSKAAELERDAIRFRFANDSQEEFAICYWHEDEDGGDWWCYGPRGCAIELLDAAIDAAIKEQT